MDEELLRLLPSGVEVLEQLEAHRRAPVGEMHIDRAVLARLRVSTGATVRELAGALMFTFESVGRALSRLVELGLVEGNDARPRAYQAIELPFEVPWGFAVRRDPGKPWLARLETDRFTRDGVRVVVFVWTLERAGDAGAAFLRTGDRAALERAASEAGLGVSAEGELVLEPISVAGIERLVEASARLDAGDAPVVL